MNPAPALGFCHSCTFRLSNSDPFSKFWPNRRYSMHSIFFKTTARALRIENCEEAGK